MPLEMLLLNSYLITQALEILLALLWKIKRRDLAAVVLVNTVTNPLVVLIHFLLKLVLRGTIVSVLLVMLEVLVVQVEGFVYKRVWQKGKRPYLFSISANICSFFGGIVFAWIRHILIG